MHDSLGGSHADDTLFLFSMYNFELLCTRPKWFPLHSALALLCMNQGGASYDEVMKIYLCGCTLPIGHLLGA